MDTRYLAGFFDGEGSFIARIKPDARYRLSSQIELSISITQKDREVLELIKNFYDMGHVYLDNKRHIYELRIGKFRDIQRFLFLIKDYIIVKRRDMDLFLKCLDMVSNKKHLQNDGFNEIKEVISLLHSRNGG